MQTITLNKLTVSPLNVRKLDASDVTELKASIKSHGLIQNLTVIKGKKGKFEVIAGGRRLLALQALASQGEISADYEVPCVIREASDAVEVSLAENAMRKDMHPADQYKAFKTMKDEGRSEEHIAASFGVPALHVKKMLKLATVSPVIFEQFAAGLIDLEAIKAFTMTDEHAKQEEVLLALGDDRVTASSVRRLLSEGKVTDNDLIVQFVGKDAYLKAGGAVETDLFSTTVHFTDKPLLETLKNAKLEALKQAALAEGWAWVIVEDTVSSHTRYHAPRISPEGVPLTETETEEYKRLDALDDEYRERVNNDDELSSDEQEAWDKVTARLQALNDKENEFSPDEKAKAGVHISMGWRGETLQICGLLEEAEEEEEENGEGTTEENSDAPAPVKAEHSQALQRELAGHCGAALRCDMMDNAALARDTLIVTLAAQAFYRFGRSYLSLQSSSMNITYTTETVEGSLADTLFNERMAYWKEQLPTEESELFSFIKEMENEQRGLLLAFLVSRMIGVSSSNAELMEKANTDMTTWWKPTIKNYLGRISKKQILSLVEKLCDRRKAQSIEGMKKAALQEAAEKLIDGKNWLPAEMRVGEVNKPAEEALAA